MRRPAESIAIGLLVIVILAAAIVLLSAVTASYSDAQEQPTATIEVPTATAEALPTDTPIPVPTAPLPFQVHHSSDVNFDGRINVVDLYIVAQDVGESGVRGAPGVCAVETSIVNAFELVLC